MKKYSLLTFFLLYATTVLTQEQVVNGNFAIRDFEVYNDTIYYIEKRHILYHDLPKRDTVSNKYFIGGYGLRLFNNSLDHEIISVSNEFEQLVSSLRFYSKKTKTVNDVYYYKYGKAVDACIVPEISYAVVSYTNNKILIIDYKSKPVFTIVHEIENTHLARAILYKKNKLFYAIDNGKVFCYDFFTKTKKTLFNINEPVTTLQLTDNHLICTTLSGKVLKMNTISNKTKTITIKNDFALSSKVVGNKLFLGTFKGTILVVDINLMKVNSELKKHKKSVLKISETDNNELYSSSLDMTIKKMNLKLNNIQPE